MGLRRIVAKQKSVGNIVSTFGGEVLLSKRGSPTDRGQNLPYQIVFRLRLIRRVSCRELRENGGKVRGKPCDLLLGNFGPVREARDRVREKITREQAALVGLDHQRNLDIVE